VVGQLAKIRGCRAVGIAGGKAKCDYVVKELGFDACVDYKAGNLQRDLKEACPKGVDVYFENVGGEMTDVLLRVMNPFSRMIVCGLIAEYNTIEPYGLKMFRAILVNRVKVQGMIVFDWKDRYGEALKDLGAHVAAGRMKYRESVVEGLENAPHGKPHATDTRLPGAFAGFDSDARTHIPSISIEYRREVLSKLPKEWQAFDNCLAISGRRLLACSPSAANGWHRFDRAPGTFQDAAASTLWLRDRDTRRRPSQRNDRPAPSARAVCSGAWSRHG
jgi:hypothetical protein